MNYSMNPYNLLAHWVPGFIVVFLLAYVGSFFDYWSLTVLFVSNSAALIVLMMAVSASIAGLLVDAIRNVFYEDNKIKWDAFFRCQDKRLDNLVTYYYVYYLFDINVVIALLLSFALSVVMFFYGLSIHNCVALSLISSVYCQGKSWFPSLIVFVAILSFGIMLYLDARCLRRDIERHSNAIIGYSETDHNPDQGVYTRLKPSVIHSGGVGVFAITHISKGTEIFSGDESELVNLDSSVIKTKQKSTKQLYDDFCVITNKGGKYRCPKNFNNMTVAWFLNHSSDPNVEPDKDFRFFAKRDINEGEELSANYDTYNEWADGERPSYLIE